MGITINYLVLTFGLKDNSNTSDYKLSIQVSLDGFSFLIGSEKEVVAYNCSQLKISGKNLIHRHFNDWINSFEILKNSFSSKEIYLFEESFTLVPEEFNRREIVNCVDDFLLEKDKILVENRIEEVNPILRFRMDKDLYETIHKLLPGAHIFHPVKFLIEKKVETETLNTAFLVVMKTKCFLIITRKEKLILATSFSVNHETDLLYYIINAFQQMQIARSQTSLFLPGVILPIAGIENLLKPYFSKFIRWDDNPDTGEQFKNLHSFLHF